MGWAVNWVMGKSFVFWIELPISMRVRPEAAMALRKRLNETVEELEKIKKDSMELEVRFDTVNRELTIAKSDCEASFCRSRSHINIPSSSDTREQRPTRHSCESS